MTDSDFTIGFKQGQEHGIQIMRETIEDIKQEIQTMCDNAKILYDQENGREDYSFGRKQVLGTVHDDLTEILEHIDNHISEVRE